MSSAAKSLIQRFEQGGVGGAAESAPSPKVERPPMVDITEGSGGASGDQTAAPNPMAPAAVGDKDATSAPARRSSLEVAASSTLPAPS